jgi:alpha-tubulin suppressor-like RCC1 family protein
MAIKTDGTLWAWGWNRKGQLGINGNVDGFTGQSSPVQVGALTTWAQVSAGSEHTAAVKTDGTIWSWGYNGNAELGDNTTISRSSPVQIGSLTNWAQVSAGSYHTTSVKTDGTFWAWGSNPNGQLGDGTVAAKSSPVQVGALTSWSNVSAGGRHTLALLGVV